MRNNLTKLKDTEIGQIPEDWEVLKVEDFAEVVGGGTPATKDPENFTGDIPWLTPRDLSTYQARFISKGERNISEKGLRNSGAKLLPEKTILLTSRAPVGYLAIASDKISTNQGFQSLLPQKQFDSLFLFYLLKNDVERLRSFASGSTFQELSGGVLRKMLFALPSLAEQQKIAEVLGSLDDKIELNRKMNKTLESLGQAVFNNLFCHLKIDPESKKLDELADVTIGRTPPRKQTQWFSTSPSDIKWVSIKDMGSCGIFINKTSEYLKREAVTKFNVPIIPENTLIMSFKLTVGRLAITAEEMVSNEAIAHLKIKNSLISKEYLFYFLKNFDYSTLGSTSSIATAINSQTIKSIDILIPELQKMERFHKTIKPIFANIQLNEQEIKTLSQLRDSLLPRLMSGKLRVT